MLARSDENKTEQTHRTISRAHGLVTAGDSQDRTMIPPPARITAPTSVMSAPAVGHPQHTAPSGGRDSRRKSGTCDWPPCTPRIAREMPSEGRVQQLGCEEPVLERHPGGELKWVGTGLAVLVTVSMSFVAGPGTWPVSDWADACLLRSVRGARRLRWQWEGVSARLKGREIGW